MNLEPQALRTHLVHGADYHDLYHQAAHAADVQHVNLDPMLDLAQHAQCIQVLPAFGFTSVAQITAPYLLERNTRWPRQYTAWITTPESRQFMIALQHAVAQTIIHEPQPDGTLIESVSLVALAATWQQARVDHAVPETMQTPDAVTMQLAAALAARTIGVPWDCINDAWLRRHLPAHPLRLPTLHTPLRAQYGNSDRVTWVSCVAWAALPAGDPFTDDSPYAEIIMASFVGWQKLLKGIWAAMLDRKRTLLALPYTRPHSRTPEYIAARRLVGKRRYQTFWNERPLARSGLAHLVVEANEACQPRNGHPFAHIVGTDGTPDYGRFIYHLDAALRLPFQPAWAADMWQAACCADPAMNRPALITKVPAYGCTAYWVRADLDAAWGPIISRLAGASGDACGMIDRTGACTSTTATIAVQLDDDVVDESVLRAA